MTMQQLQHFVLAGAFLNGHQLVLAGHDVANRIVQLAFETHVATGDDPDQFIAIDHGHTGNIVLTGQIEHFPDRCLRPDRNRVLDHAGFVLLDDADLLGLAFDAHVLCE